MTTREVPMRMHARTATNRPDRFGDAHVEEVEALTEATRRDFALTKL